MVERSKIAGNQNEAKRRLWLYECIYRFISNVVWKLIRLSPKKASE
jgi:hypothetical protein